MLLNLITKKKKHIHYHTKFCFKSFQVKILKKLISIKLVIYYFLVPCFSNNFRTAANFTLFVLPYAVRGMVVSIYNAFSQQTESHHLKTQKIEKKNPFPDQESNRLLSIQRKTFLGKVRFCRNNSSFLYFLRILINTCPGRWVVLVWLCGRILKIIIELFRIYLKKKKFQCTMSNFSKFIIIFFVVSDFICLRHFLFSNAKILHFHQQKY